MLAIKGGDKVRHSKMPARIALGDKEEEQILAVIKYYRELNEDPKYCGFFEEKFCDEFSKFMGGGYTNAVASGTGGIYVAMKACEIPENSDVLISPVTCSGALSCITEQGHTPVVVDSAKNSYNTSLSEIRKRVTPKTKAIQITHSAGEPVPDIKAIASFAKENQILLIEDCSQAIGAKVDGELVGSFGDASAFSTMYRKNLAAGASSGLVFTKDYEIFKKILAYGDRGKILWEKDLDFRDPKHSVFPALNWNTDEFSCAIGLANLSRLEDTNRLRRKFLTELIELMAEKIKICTPYSFHDGFAPFYFPIFVNTIDFNCSKMDFAKAIEAEGIPIGHHYGCLISTWPWAEPFLSDKFVAKNAIATRDSCFHLYLNEKYGRREVLDIVHAMEKIQSHFSS